MKFFYSFVSHKRHNYIIPFANYSIGSNISLNVPLSKSISR